MKMTKKILSVILCAFMVLGSVAVGGSGFPGVLGVKASAEEFGTYEGLDYVIEDGKVRIYDYSGKTDGTVTVPAEIDGYPVIVIDSYVFSGRGNITEVVLPNSITDIGDGAFRNCTGLKTINIPDSVTAIGENAFYGVSNICYSEDMKATGTPWGALTVNGVYDGDFLFADAEKTKLTKYSGSDEGKITVPDTVESIGDMAFYGCEGITGIVIPDGVESIGEGAFYGCSSLADVVIPDSVTDIGSAAFAECSALCTVTLGNGIKSLGEGAFYKCELLTDIIIPDSTEVIGRLAFAECSNLKSVTIGNAVKSIGSNAFSNCEKIKTVMIPDSVLSIGEDAFKNVENVCYSENMKAYGSPWGAKYVNAVNDGYLVFSDTEKTNLVKCDTDAEGAIIIPDGTQTIGDRAFRECKKITSVMIPDSVTKIGNEAFYLCEEISDLKIGARVKTIGEWAFSGCNSLTSVIIPGSVTDISKSAFRACESLESVTLPEGLTAISEGLFENDRKLVSVNIPDSVKSIGAYAFFYCESYGSITVPDGVTSIGRQAFQDVTNVVYSENMKATGSPWGAENVNLFYEDSLYYSNFSKANLVLCNKNAKGNITVPDGVTDISESAFSCCYFVTGVTLPDSIKSIGNGAFYFCEALQSINIPDGITVIGEYTFCGCKKLTSVTIPAAVTDIGDYAFYCCDGLTGINIPDRVETIGREAFSECEKAEIITIGSGVKEIGEMAFAYCTSAFDVTIPDNVKTIGEDAFYKVVNINYSENMAAAGSPWGAFAANGFVEGNLVFTDSSRKVLLKCKKEASGTVVIPEGVETICDYAFEECSFITDISIPSTVKTIGCEAFSECEGLTGVVIPDSVTSLADYAFEECSSLERAVIGNGVETLGKRCFEECESLTELTIGSKVKAIDKYAFQGCSSLVSVVIPDSVEVLGGSAFAYCTSLKNITFGNGLKTIDTQAFEYCISLETVILPDSVELIGTGAFGFCINLSNIILGDGLKTISGMAFWLTGLEKVIIPDSTESIGEKAFFICPKLAWLHIPSGVTEIGDGITEFDRATYDEYIAYYCENDFVTQEQKEEILAVEPVEPYICSDSDESRAKTYAEEKDLEFIVCEGHDSLNGVIEELNEARKKYVSDEAKQIIDDAIIKIVGSADVDYFTSIRDKALDDADEADKELADEKAKTVNDLKTAAGENASEEMNKIVSDGIEKVNSAANMTDLASARKDALDKIADRRMLESLTVPADDVALGFKETKNLNAESAAGKVTYKSSDEKVVTVDENGNVTAVGRGTATVTASLEGTDVTAEIKVTVSYTFWDIIVWFFRTVFSIFKW